MTYVNMNLNLSNKNALVCGSTQGIGRATALGFAQLGVNVTLIARNKSKLKQLISTLPASGGQKHQYLCADFRNPQELEEVIKLHIQEGNAYHILVNNTGGPPGGPVLSAELQEFDTAFRQHLKCNHILVKALVPGMKMEKYGRIINVISTSVKQPIEGLGVSNTIRGAVANWSKTLAAELGPFGITVNNVLPGFTNTERLAEIIKNSAKKTNRTIEETEVFMKNTTPAKRFAEPAEIANAVVFLGSEAASYVNGINFPVDGGRTKSL